MATFTKVDDIDVPQSVGKYTDGTPASSSILQVFQPTQGRDLFYKNPKFNAGSTEITQSLDNRIPLGTYTLNNRDFWENNNFNESTFQPYFIGDNSTIESISVTTPDGDVVRIAADHIYDNATQPYLWSIDALPFVVNPNNDDIIHLDRYYDKQINPTEYELATEGKINYYLSPRYSGRGEYNNNATEDNIDIFSNRALRTKALGKNYFDWQISASLANDAASTNAFYLFKLNWGDGSEIEYTSEPKILESTVMFEHFYDNPGFYIISGLVYQLGTGLIRAWEKFETNILLNPSVNYELDLFDYNNFASIGGITKDSTLVKSLYSMVAIHPLTQDNSGASEEVIEKLNTFDKLQILNVLGKVDYQNIEPYYNFLSPYQTPTDDQDSYAFGCPDYWATNYYFIDQDGQNPNGAASASFSDSGLQLIDDGTCLYYWPVTIQLRVVDGPNGNIIDGATVPYSDELTQDVPSQLFPKFVFSNGQTNFLINESIDSPGRSWGDDLQQQIQDNNEFVVLLAGQNAGHTFRAPDLWGMGAGDNEAERLISTLHVDWYFDGWYENGVKQGNSSTLYNHQFNANTTIEARFYYQDTIPPLEVQNPIFYNAAQPYSITYGQGEGETTYTMYFPTENNAIYIRFEAPEETTGLIYGDLSHFEIIRSYWDHINEVDIIEPVGEVAFTYDFSLEGGTFLDENLLYRDYTYTITSVDTNGLRSPEVVTDSLRPTPDDLIPHRMTLPEDPLNQTTNYTVEFQWNPVDEFTYGIEGDFGYYEIEIIKEIGDVITITIEEMTTDSFSLTNTSNIQNFIPSETLSFKIRVWDGTGHHSGYTIATSIQTQFSITGEVELSTVYPMNDGTTIDITSIDDGYTANVYLHYNASEQPNYLFLYAYTKQYDPTTGLYSRIYNLDDYFTDTEHELISSLGWYTFNMFNVQTLVQTLPGQTFYIGLFADTIHNLIDETLELTFGPIFGCMDETAPNYNQFATEDDDSCITPPSVYWFIPTWSGGELYPPIDILMPPEAFEGNEFEGNVVDMDDGPNGLLYTPYIVIKRTDELTGYAGEFKVDYQLSYSEDFMDFGVDFMPDSIENANITDELQNSGTLTFDPNEEDGFIRIRFIITVDDLRLQETIGIQLSNPRWNDIPVAITGNTNFELNIIPTATPDIVYITLWDSAGDGWTGPTNQWDNARLTINGVQYTLSMDYYQGQYSDNFEDIHTVELGPGTYDWMYERPSSGNTYANHDNEQNSWQVALPDGTILLEGNGASGNQNGTFTIDDPPPDATYTLSLTLSGGGQSSVVTGGGLYNAGEQVTIHASTDANLWAFSEWQSYDVVINLGGMPESTTTTITMPANNIDLIAKFVQIEGP